MGGDVLLAMRRAALECRDGISNGWQLLENTKCGFAMSRTPAAARESLEAAVKADSSSPRKVPGVEWRAERQAVWARWCPQPFRRLAGRQLRCFDVW